MPPEHEATGSNPVGRIQNSVRPSIPTDEPRALHASRLFDSKLETEEFRMIVVNRRSASVLRTPHGSEIRPLVDRTNSPAELCSLAEETLPAGRAVVRHHHTETEEIYYVTSGAGRMTVGAETREVAAGDCVFIPRNSVHTIENTGAEPMTILLVCGPAYSAADHHAETAEDERV